MVYDDALAVRVRAAVSELAPFDEKKMFGGLAFMVNTHMACGLVGGELMVRVGSEQHDEAISRGAREMDFTGRPMRGMVMVSGAHLATDAALGGWVARGVAHAQAEPSKPPKPSKSR